MKKRMLTVLGLLILTFAIGAQPITNETDADKAAREKREKKAMELLEQVLAEAQSLKLPENRLRIKVMAAGYLWEKDETRARAFFQEAENDLRQMLQTISQETENRQRKIEAYNQFRHELLSNLSQQDPQLALQLLQATRLPEELKRPGQNNYDPDQQLENDLTTRINSRNPTQALKAAEELLQKGLSPQMLSLLDTVRPNEQNRLALTDFYQRVIRKLATEDILGNNDAVQVTESLLQRAYGESYLRANVARTNAARPPSLVTDEQMLRELVEIASKAAVKSSSDPMRTGNANRLKNTLQSIQPAVEKYAPTQSAALKTRPVTPDGTAPLRNTYSEFNTLANNAATTPEQMLDFIKKAPAQEQPNLYTSLAQRTLAKGDPERAKQIMETHVKDPDAKDRFDRTYENTMLNNALQKGDTAAAKQLIASLPSPTRKAEHLIQLASRLAAKGDKTEAGNLLEEASALTGTQVENAQQVVALVNLARAFATVSPERSFALTDAMVAKFNPVIAAASVLDGFEMRNGFEQGEARLSSGGSMYWLNNFNSLLPQLANIDIERAQASAERFERAELRLQALLHVAGGVLRSRTSQRMNYGAPPPPPPPPPAVRRP